MGFKVKLVMIKKWNIIILVLVSFFSFKSIVFAKDIITYDLNEKKNITDAVIISNVNTLTNFSFINSNELKNIVLLDNDLNDNNDNSTGTDGNTNDNSVDNNDCSILGDFKGDLQSILDMIRIFAPLLAAVISVYEYLAVLFMKNADELKKANKRLIKRLFLIAALWLLPTFLNLVLDLIDSGDYSTCIK